MGFLKDIIGGAVKGVKSIVSNARLGQQAKAAGFIQPSAQSQQQAFIQANVAQSNNRLILFGLAILAGIGLIIAIFKRK